MNWVEDINDNAFTCQAAFLRMFVWKNTQGKWLWEVKCAGFVLSTGVAIDVEVGKGAAELALIDLTDRLHEAVVNS